MAIQINFEPAEHPDHNLEIPLTDNLSPWNAVHAFLYGFEELYGPFDDGKFGALHEVLEHLADAFRLLEEGENPAVAVRSVPGDEESNFKLTVTVTE